mgnify:CR=1 FL=1
MPNLYTVMITFESEGDAEAFMVGENIFSLAAPAYDILDPDELDQALSSLGA